MRRRCHYWKKSSFSAQLCKLSIIALPTRLVEVERSRQTMNGQVKQAIESLERGRALIWSEMRGFRTSSDHLRAANLALADKFADINRRLESVTTSVAQGDGDEILGGSEAGTGPREHSIG